MDRRHPISDFDANQFREFFGNQTISLEARLLSGGACNSNYSVRTPKGDQYVCRIHHRGNPQAEKAAMELLNHSIPTPGYLWIGDGVSIMPFVEGSHFRPTKNLVQEAGRMIGKLHTINLDRAGQITPNGEVTPIEGWDTYSSGILGMLEKEAIRSHLDEATLLALKDLVERHLDLLHSFDASHNLVHGDFRPDNILVSGDSITGVLDWEFAHSGCSYMDIGNLLRHIPSEWEQDLAWGLQSEGFELPDDWRFRSLLIDLVSHLEFLTSNRSEDFKRSCIERISHLIKRSTEYGVAK
ncbi:phosphotransferase family protein [Rubritalea sp.]|uniref:phosphotransferase family protein n=1 Tax=Rubritalea sp. TaxID=2109375 RepID=UPI003EF4CAC3